MRPLIEQIIEEGVQATLRLITAAELDQISGRYFNGLGIGANREPGL
jgi:hypothetical protein